MGTPLFRVNGNNGGALEKKQRRWEQSQRV